MYKNTGKTHEKPILWGVPGSLYAGKTRSYLITKGIEYREIFTSNQRYMEEIVPLVGHFAIPVTELSDGTLIQDSTDTILHFEQHVPELAIIPESPLQNSVAWLLGFFCSESMWKLGLHYRWTYLEHQQPYVEALFGRALSTARTTAERNKQAAPAIAHFSSKLVELGVNEKTIPSMEASYEELLDLLNEHFFHYPYLMGGRPSLADFGLIAPFFAHLARDPYPSTHMKNRAPNVFRWTERMFLSGFADGEFPDLEPDFLAADALPSTLLPVIAYFFKDFSAEIIGMVESYNQWCSDPSNTNRGTVIQDPDEAGTTHPSLAWFEFECRGVRHRRRGSVDIVYHLQRVFDVVEALDDKTRATFDSLVAETGGENLMGTQIARRIACANYQYVLA